MRNDGHETSHGSITRLVFLPKGSIYGDYAYDPSIFAGMELTADTTASEFSRQALQPAYIYKIRRDQVYAEGKRILTADPLTPIERR